MDHLELKELFMFATIINSIILLILVLVKSRLHGFVHRLLFLFILNYVIVFAEQLLNLVTTHTFDFASYSAFGPLVFLFVFYTLFPKGKSFQRGYWLFLFLPFVLEVFCAVMLFVQPDPMQFISNLGGFIKGFSFYYFFVFVALSGFVMWKSQFGNKTRILYNVDVVWLWGLFILFVVVSIAELFVQDVMIMTIQYLFILFITIYLILFLSFQPGIVSELNALFEDKLRSVFIIKDRPIFLIDLNNKIVFANDLSLKLTGYSLGELSGKTIKFSSHVPSVEPTEQLAERFELKMKMGQALMCEFKSEYITDDSARSFYLITLLASRVVVKSSEASDLIERLNHLINNEKWYLRQDLQQSDIADELAISKRRLGELIQAHFGTSYPALINNARVSHAQRLLEDTSIKHWSLEALGLDSGFSSNSSFYKAFKDTVGVSPGEYRA